MSASRKVRPPWAFLIPDLHLDISGRLHDAADFVHFHAVCTSWRDLHSAATCPKFLPWLLSRSSHQLMHSLMTYYGRHESSFIATSRYSGAMIRSEASSSADERNWVASADGTSVWLFTEGPEPKLLDLVTGTAMPLPPFPDNDGIKRRMRNPHGIVYTDGTVFLYTFADEDRLWHHMHTSAILRPGDASWTVIQKRLDVWAGRNSCAAYHDGKVLVWANLHSWCVLTPDFQASSGNQYTTAHIKTFWYTPKNNGLYVRDRCYVLESHGELLLASVLIKEDCPYDPCPAMPVKAHKLERKPGSQMHWVASDGSSFADRVLFLGDKASFFIDAAQLGIRGGSAYFVLVDRVFRCSLVVDGEAKVLEQLLPGRAANQTHAWLQPQPDIASIQKIREKLENPSE